MNLVSERSDGSASGAPVGRRHSAAVSTQDSASPVLTVENLIVRRGPVHLVDGVSLAVKAGETLCLVGESGCGKSLTCMAMLGLTDTPLIAQGAIRIFGKEVVGASERRLNAMRGREAAMIFQNPMVALNPIQRVGAQIEEILALHTDLSARQRAAEAVALFERVGLPEPARQARAYPHELSGGMCQRVIIAMAIACRPKILIADEPTTALDVTIQAQILALLRSLQRETGMAMVFVTHDLGVVAEIADRVAVMYSGRVVEEGGVDAIFDAPAHPYTRALMACRVGVSVEAGSLLPAIAGSVPSPAARPQGCAFAPRCAEAGDACSAIPALGPWGDMQHRVACHARSMTR